MSSFAVKNNCGRFDENISPFDRMVGELVEQAGLKKRVAAQFQKWFGEANADLSLSVRERKNLFVQRFVPYMEKVGGRILERSCFLQAPISEKQLGADMIHYTCLRVMDEIYDDRDELYYKWIDSLYDEGLLSATQALLIEALINRMVLSLMQKEYDETRFSSLLDRDLGWQPSALFAEGLLLAKHKFPIRDAEIVLFTEVVHALSDIDGIDRRAVFKDFLECIVGALRGYNADAKQIYFAYAEESLAEKNEIPKEEWAVKPVPRIKLEANKYWFLRIFDHVSQSRSSFAKFVDALLEEGSITFSAANEFLELKESPRTWGPFNATQQFLRIKTRYNLNLDLEEFLDAFIGGGER